MAQQQQHQHAPAASPDGHHRAKQLRNVCILAHVDHGKTTLADSLIASNGIISQRMAGKLRYMDSREDEQVRGITMKSSAISLRHSKGPETYTVNLIDSPGHIDFTSEVSTAVRLCDGAIVLVDAVEGVCAQTQVVLKQAWHENIKALLVLNKIDRLITELQMTPSEAYVHLQRKLEQVNAVMGTLFTTEALSQADQVSLRKGASNGGALSSVQPADGEAAASLPVGSPGCQDGAADMDDSSIYFSPELGNVIFASAVDGWGFCIDYFARIFAAKLGIDEASLTKSLWGDVYVHPKTRALTEGASAAGKKPLFVQLILENLWGLYDAVIINRDKDRTAKIVKALGVNVLARDLQHSDAKVTLHAICSQWMPVSKAVLDAVATQLPSPLDFPAIRAEKLLCSPGLEFHTLPAETRDLKQAFTQCSAEPDVPTIVLVSKMFAVERKYLPTTRSRPLQTAEEEAAAAVRHAQARQRYLVHARGGSGGGSSSGNAAAGTDRSPAAVDIKAGPVDAQIAEAVDSLSLTDPQQRQGQEQAPAAADSTARVMQLTVDGAADSKDEAALAFLAFARVFSGTLRPGQRLYVLGPKHDPLSALAKRAAGHIVDPALKLKDLDAHSHITQVTVGSLYTFMGRELEPMDVCEAGNIVGIAGLEEHVVRSATLCDTVACPPFTDRLFDSSPIIRVALEPRTAADMPKLVEGLRLLNQADPCVEVALQHTGEHVIAVAGELHLQRCVDDLRERYAKVELRVSEPIVPFRETVIKPPEVDMVNEAIVFKKRPAEQTVITVDVHTADLRCTLDVEAVPLPEAAIAALERAAPLLRSTRASSAGAAIVDPEHRASHCADLDGLRTQLIEALESVAWPRAPPPCCRCRRRLGSTADAAASSLGACGCRPSVRAVDRMWSFGPRHCGPNLLLNFTETFRRPALWQPAEDGGGGGHCSDTGGGDAAAEAAEASAYELLDSALVSGFQLATVSGPMCEEPMMGVAFVVSSWRVCAATAPPPEAADGNGSACDRAEEFGAGPVNAAWCGLLSGQLISAVKDGCRRAFELQPQRLMMAMYSCSILATSEALGKAYGVVSKRYGEVVDEDIKEGTSTFEVTALLPVAESFGFCEELRKKTSGLATPQLKFSHWKVLDIDPYWEPCTEEEMSLYGTKYDSENRAKKYVNHVRKRKGLRVEEQIVLSAEKQRTLTKNK